MPRRPPRPSLPESLRGYVVLRVTGARPAALLNLLISAGMPVARAQSTPGGLVVRLAVADFRRMRPLAAAAGVRVRILARGGFPFHAAAVRRRPALLAAGLVGVTTLYVLSGFVWFVQVQGTDRLAPTAVAAAAARAGLRPGAWRPRLDPDLVAAQLLAALPGLSWAEVTLHGTKADIQVVERRVAAPAYENVGVPGDVVAAHAGIVSGLSVTAGVAVVAPGARVEAGEVLIRGLVEMPSTRSRQEGPGSLRLVPVHASGIVVALSTYHAYAEAPAGIEVGVPTGRVFLRRWIEIAGRRLVIQGRGAVPFSSYRLERQSAELPQWGGGRLPLRVLTLRYVEVAPHRRLLAPAAAAAVAEAEARAFLLAQLPAEARIVKRSQNTTLLPGGRVGVELWVESEDNIGVFRPAAPSADLARSAGASS